MSITVNSIGSTEAVSVSSVDNVTIRSLLESVNFDHKNGVIYVYVNNAPTQTVAWNDPLIKHNLKEMDRFLAKDNEHYYYLSGEKTITKKKLSEDPVWPLYT
jgi:hypothetical protein